MAEVELGQVVEGGALGTADIEQLCQQFSQDLLFEGLTRCTLISIHLEQNGGGSPLTKQNKNYIRVSLFISKVFPPMKHSSPV